MGTGNVYVTGRDRFPSVGVPLTSKDVDLARLYSDSYYDLWEIGHDVTSLMLTLDNRPMYSVK